MRTSRRIVVAFALGASVLAMPALAFDGAPVNPQDAAIPVVTAMPNAAGALRKAVPQPVPNPDASFTALQYAAEGGLPIAQWQLGRMYAIGEGVAQDDLRAFAYFSRLVNAHASASPSPPQAQVVASHYVA